jgi:hypothetical protein
MINDRLLFLTAVPFLYPPARGEKVGNSFLSGVLDRRHAGKAGLGPSMYIKSYRILSISNKRVKRPIWQAVQTQSSKLQIL